MNTSDRELDLACKGYLDSFFTSYRHSALEKSAGKALRVLLASGKPLLGKPAGWAAGIVYAMANDGRYPCGVPGVLNADVEDFFGVSIGTIRKRAAQVVRYLAL